jgi:hypothetical protein
MGNVNAASMAAVDDVPVVASQAGPVEVDSPVTAQALADALDPQLVARLAAQARAQGVSLTACPTPSGTSSSPLERRWRSTSRCGSCSRHPTASW